jgi:secreted trypsin-like serine protease
LNSEDNRNMKVSLELIILLFAQVFAIYDGDDAKEHQFPHAVLVHSPQFFCAGAIISEKHIVTAAHCLMSIKAGGKAVVNIGAHEYYGGGFSDGVTMSSSKFWIHENFTMPSAVFDIGLIEFALPFNFSEKVQKVGLSTKKNADLDAEDKGVYLAGWGYTYDYSGASDELLYTNMTLMPLENCKKYKSHYVEDMNNDHICAVKIKGMPCE